MRRAIAALAAAVAVAVVAASIVTCDGGAPEPRDESPPPASPGAAERPARRPRVRAEPASESAADPAAEPAGAPDAVPPAPSAFLRIVDESGAPVPGVLVWWRDTEPGPDVPESTLTDADGRAERGEATSAVYFERTGARVVPLAGAVTQSVARGLPPLELDVVSGTTGRAAGVASVRATLAGGARHYDAMQVFLRRDGDRWVLPSVPLRRGRGARVQIDVVPDDGFVAEPSLLVDAAVGPATRTLRETLAVYREADVRVDVAAPGGFVPPAVEIDRVDVRSGVGPWAVGRRALRPVAEATAVAGAWRVRGLPSVPHLRVRLQVSTVRRDEEDPFGTWLGAHTPWLALDGAARASVVLDPADLPFEGPGSGSAIGIGGGFGGREAPLTPENSSSVVVRVLRDDGSPAAGARVTGADGRTAVADGEGRAEVVLRHGRPRVTAQLAGMLPTADVVDVPPQGEIVLREPAGRTVDVVVVDDADRPAPLASVSVDVLSWVANDGAVLHDRRAFVRVERGVQWTSLRADADGRLRLSRVPVGRLRIGASLGSSAGSAESDAADVRIVLAAPRGLDDE